MAEEAARVSSNLPMKPDALIATSPVTAPTQRAHGSLNEPASGLPLPIGWGEGRVRGQSATNLPNNLDHYPQATVPGAKVRAILEGALLRHSPWDALLVGLAVLHGALLILVPSIPLVALGLWWNANTVSHNFIHLPFFHSRASNRFFSAFLSLLLGLPQSLWKAKHLAHHREQPFHWIPIRHEWLAEGTLVFTLWAALAVIAPWFLLTVYLPGWLLGLALCELHGRLEHLRGTVSHYGRLYNWLCFNDGYHIEHHARPARHWTTLPTTRTGSETNSSRWPAVLRWLELASLDGLEELVCHSRLLQRFVLHTHTRALAKLLASIPSPQHVVIVGGGFFPRTALAVRRLFPEARLTLVDARTDRLERARVWLNHDVKCVTQFCTAANLSQWAPEADLVVIPLALRGRKTQFYQHPPVRHLLIHDWLWRPHGTTVIVSWLLLKRLNLISSSSARSSRREEAQTKPVEGCPPLLESPAAIPVETSQLP